mgnify:CR=1 FL=1
MMKRLVYYLCAVFLMLALLVAGCGQDDAEKEITSYMEEHNINGEIVAYTSAKDDAGYVGWIRLKNGKSAGVVIDTKNNQKAYITTDMDENWNKNFQNDFNEKLFYQITHPGIEDYANFRVTVYNDQPDETMFCGEWFGKDHVFPIYARYSYDNKKGISVGQIAAVSEKKGYVHDSVKLNLVKMFVEALPEFYKPVLDVSIKDGQEKYVTQSVREELTPFLKEKRIGGTILVHTPETENGYVAWIRHQNAKGVFDWAVIIDKKNNQKASVEINNVKKFFRPIESIELSGGLKVFPIMIYDDTVGIDKELGKWYGTDHLITVYSFYMYNKESGAMLLDDSYATECLYPPYTDNYVREQKNIDLVNMLTKALPVLYEPVTGKSLK